MPCTVLASCTIAKLLKRSLRWDLKRKVSDKIIISTNISYTQIRMRRNVHSFVCTWECVQARFNCWKLVKSIVCRIPIKVAVVYFYVYFYFLRLLCTVTSDEILLHWRNYTTLMSIMHNSCRQLHWRNFDISVYHAQQLQTATLKTLWHLCLSCTTAVDNVVFLKDTEHANTYIRRTHTHVSTCTHAYREVGWRAIKAIELRDEWLSPQTSHSKLFVPVAEHEPL